MLFDSDAGDALAVADVPTWLLLAMCCRRRCDVDVVIVDDGTRTRTSQKRGMAARDPYDPASAHSGCARRISVLLHLQPTAGGRRGMAPRHCFSRCCYCCCLTPS